MMILFLDFSALIRGRVGDFWAIELLDGWFLEPMGELSGLP